MKVSNEKALQTKGMDSTRGPGKFKITARRPVRLSQKGLLVNIVGVPRDVMYIQMILGLVGRASW